MNYTKNVILHVSLFDEVSVSTTRKFQKCELRFDKKMKKYNAIVNSFGWEGEILEVEFNEEKITTDKVIELIKECYKVKEV